MAMWKAGSRVRTTRALWTRRVGKSGSVSVFRRKGEAVVLAKKDANSIPYSLYSTRDRRHAGAVDALAEMQSNPAYASVYEEAVATAEAHAVMAG